MHNIPLMLRCMARQLERRREPSVTEISAANDPYRVLVACILSLRTKDETTRRAAERLFAAADTPLAMTRLCASRIARLIYPVGFYRTKSRTLRQISKRIIKDFGGRVPSSEEGLLSLKGVGRKTANLVLGLGWGVPAICVDTHVHRISNRLGWVRTSHPHQTEIALTKVVPRRLWIALNTLLVGFGQHICTPLSPCCSLCSVRRFCKRVGVERFR